MTDEAKRIVVALRTKCREEGSCDACGKNSFCYTHGDEELSDLAADLIESLSAELEATEAIAALARGLEVERDQLKARLEHVEYERDAAVEDLKDLCDVCANFETCKGPYCECCDLFDECEAPCKTCASEDNWQWRGVKEVSHD